MELITRMFLSSCYFIRLMPEVINLQICTKNILVYIIYNFKLQINSTESDLGCKTFLLLLNEKVDHSYHKNLPLAPYFDLVRFILQLYNLII
jgi:hypothetical protein